MNETDTYGFKAIRFSGDRLTVSTGFTASLKASASDPNLRDRIIEFIEENAEMVADKLLEDLDITNDEEEDYDRYNAAGDDD